MAVAAWYARRMGLPLGGCDLRLQRQRRPLGAAAPGGAAAERRLHGHQTAPFGCGASRNLERLVSQTLGPQTAELYSGTRSRRGTFALNPEQQASLRAGFSVSVVSAGRPGP